MTERAKKLLLLYCKQGRKIRRVSGLPPLTFKAKKAGTLKNYRIYGNTETKTRSYSGSAPLSFPITGGVVSNYRVYGNTVDGESVGDRTGNLFDMKKFAETASPNYATVNYSENSLKFTATRVDAYVNEVYSRGNIPDALRASCINVQPLTTYTISMNVPYKCYISWSDDSFNLVDIYTEIPENQASYTFTTPSNCTKLLFRLGKYVTNIGDTFTISDIMLNAGSTPLPYEPYGYKVPIAVTNSGTTSNETIYLPEQIKKVGDEAEYVDYATQKQHRVRKNLLQNTATSQTIQGVTFTVNSDGSVTCNGTVTSSTAILVELCSPGIELPQNTPYIITGCPSGGTITNGYKIQYYDGTSWKYEIGNGATFTVSNSNLVRLRILISPGVGVENLTFYPMIRKADIEDDTYEPYIENTDVDVILPGIAVTAGTNTLSVGTVVQPSSVAVDVGKIVSCGDRTENLFDGTFIHRSVIETTVCNDNPNRRSIVVDISNFNNGDKITFSRETSAGNVFQMYQVTSPLEGGRLLNSNVISGDSKTLLATITLDDIANYHYLMIFLNGAANPITDEELLASKIMVNVGNTPLPYEPYGYKVPVTVEGKNLVTSYLVELNGGTQFHPVVFAEVNLQPNTEYLITFTVHENGVKLYSNDLLFTSIYYSSEIQGKKTMRLKTKTGIRPDQHINNKGWVLLRNAKQNPSDFTITDVKLQLVSDAPIYLDEPLAKSGNNADYIDYATQKRHNSDGTESSVTLPEIAVTAGTNTLTVGTEAQPSDIYLKGKIKKKPKIYYKIYYYSQDGQTALSTETVEEGHDCTYSTVPTKESDTDFNYTFTGWSTTTNSTTATAGATENIQQNTNLYAAFSKSFKTDTISDSWEEIIANCDNGTYASKYQIGDLKTIDVGTEGPVQMQIVAIDTDLLASDNTKKAPITWISKQLLNTDKVMNDTSTNYLSDWTNCDMRTYLKNTVLPMLPSVVQNNIKEVTKYTNQRTGSTTFTTISSTEDIWLPSYREISNNTSNCETSGVQYNSIFTDDASRVKSKVGNRANIWWTRSASGHSSSACSYSFVIVYNDGTANRTGSYCIGFCGVAIGFCT